MTLFSLIKKQVLADCFDLTTGYFSKKLEKCLFLLFGLKPKLALPKTHFVKQEQFQNWIILWKTCQLFLKDSEPSFEGNHSFHKSLNKHTYCTVPYPGVD